MIDLLDDAGLAVDTSRAGQERYLRPFFVPIRLAMVGNSYLPIAQMAHDEQLEIR